jgi:hypothetical protein
MEKMMVILFVGLHLWYSPDSVAQNGKEVSDRKALYEKLGRAIDETVEDREEPAEFFKRHGMTPDPNKPLE